MNHRTAAATHHRRSTLIPTQPDPTPIEDTGLPDNDGPTCTHHMPGCEHIRCTLRDGHPGLCWNVTRRPYVACYWEKPT